MREGGRGRESRVREGERAGGQGGRKEDREGGGGGRTGERGRRGCRERRGGREEVEECPWGSAHGPPRDQTQKPDLCPGPWSLGSVAGAWGEQVAPPLVRPLAGRARLGSGCDGVP